MGRPLCTATAEMARWELSVVSPEFVSPEFPGIQRTPIAALGDVIRNAGHDQKGKAAHPERLTQLVDLVNWHRNSVIWHRNLAP